MSEDNGLKGFAMGVVTVGIIELVGQGSAGYLIAGVMLLGIAFMRSPYAPR